MRLRILSINVRGLGSPTKVNLLCQELERLNYDIFLLQETHVSCLKQTEHVERVWRGKCFWSFGIGKSADGRILSLLTQLNSFKFNLVNIYAPNTVSDRKTFFEQLHFYFLSQGDYVIAGDFNCVDRAIDKFHSRDFHSSDKSALAALKADFSLVDVYGKLNPSGISFTWSNSSHSQASTLDRFFISQSLLNGVCSNEILPCTFSDHDFV